MCYFYVTQLLYSGDYSLQGMCLLQAKPVHILPCSLLDIALSALAI